MKNILTFVAGLLFGIGLISSGMTNPSKVIGFLDLFGYWDPSLILVMLGAIPVALVGFGLIERKRSTMFNEPLHLSGKTHLNKSLIIGSFIFGSGWALAGFCPGPALVSLGSGNVSALIFVGAMIAGMVFHDHLYRPVFEPKQS